MLDDFAIFILSHGRADKVITLKTLERSGYTGQVYIVIDNEDETAQKYYDNFGEMVIMFDKSEVAQTFDEGDNFDDRRTITYARNAAFQIARDLGLTYFMELDDDYRQFGYTYIAEYPFKNHPRPTDNMDKIIGAMLEFFKETPRLASIAFSQTGDFVGGIENGFIGSRRTRKCMNSFILSTQRQFDFLGRMNEDVNTYLYHQAKGLVFLTVPMFSVQQERTQSNPGGITELYLNYGTYVKSFYSVMYAPSCVRVSMMRSKHSRLHHSINWG